MKKHNTTQFCVLSYLFLTMPVFAQLKLPDDGFVTGWSRAGHMRQFNGNELYDYINGGAELFLEFGFKKVAIQEYRHNDNEVTIEHYCMENPPAALGIFLIKRGREQPLPQVEGRNTGNRYQLTLVKNRYFMLINNFSGKEAVIPVMIEAANFMLNQIEKSPEIKLLKFLPDSNFMVGSELLIRGQYGLQPLYTFGKGDILHLEGRIFAVAGDYRDAVHGKYTRIIIPYPDKKTASFVFNYLRENLDPYLKIMDISDNRLVFKDYQDKFGLVMIKQNVIDIKINLRALPVSG